MSRSRQQLKRELLKRIEKNRRKIVSICSKIIQIPTENPSGDTTLLAGLLKDYLRELGLKVKTYGPKKNMPNIVATYGSKSGNNLVVSAHMDVFPAGQDWSFPPFCGRITDSRILGRGAVDMKAGLTASLCALECISAMDIPLHGRVTLTFVSDEESMGTWGTQWLLSHVPEVKGDACLIGEPGGTDVITIGEKGIWWFKLTSKGTEAHAAYGAGENAIVKLSKAILITEQLQRLRGKIPSDLKKLILSQKQEIEKKYWRGTERAIDHLTINAGLVSGGLKNNLVPPSCEASFDSRLPLGLSPKKVERRLRKSFEAASLEGIRMETQFSIEPNYTKPDNRIVELAAINVSQIARRSPKLYFRLGSTDGKFFRLAGVPVVTYGPSPHTMGEVDEYVKIEELLTVAKVHAGIIFDYLS